MGNDDISYFAKRAEAERRLARDSANAAVRSIHQRLAEGYQARLSKARLCGRTTS